MSETKQKLNLNVYLGLIGVALVLVILVVFWPSKNTDTSPSETAVDAGMPTPTIAPAKPVEEESFTPPPPPEEVTVIPEDTPPPVQEASIEPEPLDTSDIGIMEMLTSNAGALNVGRFFINDNMLQRFVVLTTNLADEQNAPNHQLLIPPEQAFRTYQQAGKTWIDAASYKRYTPYVDMLEAFDDKTLLDMYTLYRDSIQELYAEIGDPNRTFESVLVQAINRLLDTPEVPVPVEVYTDSVMYKYADPRLENLSAPQKQLLRTGPDNMRRIKAKLRVLRNRVENGSE